MKKVMSIILTLAMLVSVLVGCAPKAEQPKVEQPKVEKKKDINLATTTSTQDSGLLDYLLPKFTEETGYKVNVVAVGTGQAIKLGQDGNADVILVHAKADEEKFVAEGYGVKRYQVMYNDFVVVGPEEDPAGIKAAKDASEAVKLIAEKKSAFVSRGDDSGTHKFENKLWKKVGIEPKGDWYISAGKGMGDVLTMASEKKAYTIADRATYLAMRDKLDIKIVFEKSNDLKNQYGVIAVSPEKYPDINKEGAEAFINWLVSEKVQNDIASFGKDKYGESLFVPNANE
jgi:tungstate transport system substrate-binding protein